jgi:hypothetical protein
LNAGNLTGPLTVANQNGVIVGATGQITAPSVAIGGIGLLGYVVDPGQFGTNKGAITIDTSTIGTGTVSVAAGASITNDLLVATNGTVNIGTTSGIGGRTFVAAGYGGTFSPDTGVLTPTGPLSNGTGSVINITPAANDATLAFTGILAGGAVNNSANLNVPAILGTAQVFKVAGLFTNSGVLNHTAGTSIALDGSTTNNTDPLAGGLVNTGVVNELGTGGLSIVSAKGNIQSTGNLNLVGGGSQSLALGGANVDLEGTVTAGSSPATSKALSSTNQLANLTLQSAIATPSKAGGVVDIATSLFTNGNVFVSGNAIRVLSGGITSSGEDIFFAPGTKASAVADPFYNLTSLNYTFSLFGGAQITGTGTNSVVGIGSNPESGDTSFSTSPGLNINGQISAPTIVVAANNINSNNGLNGGFVLPNGGTLGLLAYGNVNNPNGAAANGSSSFLYNYVPVTVGANGTKAGTATILLAGPSASSSLEQNFNLLVNGNVTLGDMSQTFANSVFGSFTLGGAALAIPNLPTATQSPYANNHLVVTATGNIGFTSAGTSATTSNFYWPGLVYLTSGATASNPTAAPNATASISLANADTDSGVNKFVNVNNLIPADLTTASVGGQTGHGGIFFETNNLNLAGGTVTTSNDSWVNFLTPALASAFQTTSNASFLGGVISSNTVNTQKLPAGDFQPQ